MSFSEICHSCTKNGRSINRCLDTHSEVLCNPSSILVLDAFRGHLTENYKNNLAQKITNLVIIPGGMH